MLDAGGAVEAADGLAVIGELGEVHPVVGQLDAGGQAEVARDLVFVFGKRLEATW